MLQPPNYGQLITQGQPVLLFANLLQHEPANVVVRRDMADSRGLSPALPLAERLRRLQGLRVDATPGPVNRLGLLFASAGMDADRDIQVVLVPGEEQNAAFARNQVDALFAHTPYLEDALVRQGGVLVVNLSAGEVAFWGRFFVGVHKW